MPVWIELVLLVAGLGTAAFLIADLGRRRRQRQRERRHLERLAAGAPSDDDLAPPPGRLERRLRAAGLGAGPAAYAAAAAIFAALVALGVLEAFPGALVVAALAGLVALWLPWALISAWARRRARRFEEKLVDGVGFMVSALQAGENPTQSLVTAAAASEAPAAAELARIVDRLDLGMAIRKAVEPMMAGYDSEGTRLFSQTLIAKWTVGGDLAPVLHSVSRIMRERLAMRLRLRSELAGARLSAVIVAVLPYTIVPVMLWRRPEWIRSLIEHPLGLRMLFGALLLQLVGFLWLRRMLRGSET